MKNSNIILPSFLITVIKAKILSRALNFSECCILWRKFPKIQILPRKFRWWRTFLRNLPRTFKTGAWMSGTFPRKFSENSFREKVLGRFSRKNWKSSQKSEYPAWTLVRIFSEKSIIFREISKYFRGKIISEILLANLSRKMFFRKKRKFWIFLQFGATILPFYDQN